MTSPQPLTVSGKIKEDDFFRPQSPKSAYGYFVDECRQLDRKLNPNAVVACWEFYRKCGRKWMKMSNEEKKRFKEMEAEDRIRYEEEMLWFSASTGTTVGDEENDNIQEVVEIEVIQID